jgi:hypothetical protein
MIQGFFFPELTAGDPLAFNSILLSLLSPIKFWEAVE